MTANGASSVIDSSSLGGIVAGQTNEFPHPPYSFPDQVLISTQKTADLYRSGTRFWTKNDLKRIEEQLANFQFMLSFTIRRIDGSMVFIKNPMFGVYNPIWKPYVVFQNYWDLVGMGPPKAFSQESPPYSLPFFSYFIDWENQAFEDFIAGEQPNPSVRFQNTKQRWEESSTCEWLKRKLAILQGPRKITKLVCFALGDMAPPSRYDHRFPPEHLDDSDIPRADKVSAYQHAAALTIASMLRTSPTNDFEIFAQDPAYSQTTKEVLKNEGITVVGEHGAGGFSKVDNDSAVFFRFPGAPVCQIIADLARPAIIIGNERGYILNENRRYPFPCDAESPRTRDMFEEYTEHDFEIVESDKKDMVGLTQLKIYVRKTVAVAEDLMFQGGGITVR